MAYTLDVKRRRHLPWERHPELYTSLPDAVMAGARMVMQWGVDAVRFTEQPDDISQGAAYAQRLTNDFIRESCR